METTGIYEDVMNKNGITNWIPPSFGATYQLKVYAEAGQANPQTNGTQLFETVHGNDQWYFDYQSMCYIYWVQTYTNMIGATNVIFVAGAKYTGLIMWCNATVQVLHLENPIRVYVIRYQY